jgi:hypothetical protein
MNEEENELRKKSLRMISIIMFLFSGLIFHLISIMVYKGGISLLLENPYFLFLIIVAFAGIFIGYGIMKLHIWSYYLSLLFLIGFVVIFVYNIIIGDFPSIFQIIGFIGVIIAFSFLRKNKKLFENLELKQRLTQKFSEIISPNKEIIMIFVIYALIVYVFISFAIFYSYDFYKSICERYKKTTEQTDCHEYALGIFSVIAPMIGIPISLILESKFIFFEILGMLQWLVLLYLGSIFFHCYHRIRPKVKIKFK